MAGRRSDLGRYCLERVTGIEPALSAWEVCGAARLPPADSVTCGDLDSLTVSDHDYPQVLLSQARSGHVRGPGGQ
jgi:hypothetical protein